MKVVFCIIEPDSPLSSNEIRKLSGLSSNSLRVKILSDCTAGNEKRCALISDIYLWTCKYWYGLYAEKLAYIELRGISEIPPLFMLKFSKQLRLAIYSEKLAIFDKEGVDLLRTASSVSAHYFKEERIEALKKYIPILENYYKVLYHYNNPFT